MTPLALVVKLLLLERDQPAPETPEAAKNFFERVKITRELEAWLSCEEPGHDFSGQNPNVCLRCCGQRVRQ